MMAKCQQMDIYSKPLDNDPKDADLEHNYNPDGRTRLEDDALVLRELWNQLTDYANLDFEGQVRSGPGKHRFVLSSDREALVYLSSDTGKQGVNFAETSLALRGLALAEGTYKADIIRPDTGTDATVTVTVNNGRAAIALPAFTDDLAVHIFRDSAVS